MSEARAQSVLESGIQPTNMPESPRGAYAAPLADSLGTSLSRFGDLKDLYSPRPLAAGAISLSSVECPPRRFVLREPIQVREGFERGVWTRCFDRLGILAHGSSREEAAEAFGAEFACCWDDVACEEDSGLTADAQQLKAALLEIVRRVEDL